MAKKPEIPSLEEQLKRLEEIAQILDRGDVPLEDQLALFSEGMALATACREYLEQAELRVKRITE
ncbi:MAG: exodeoxyribonuclease VII small subunit [Ignavibacteriae bacterium]|nr:MAG: exodeoxyribonuclease VII small subunit [Ignavibacteriota bacterium]